MSNTRKPIAMSPLRAARQKANLSIDALAERAGVSRATIWNAEKDPARLTDETMAAVGRALNLDPKLLRPKMSLAVIDLTRTAKALEPASPQGQEALKIVGRADRVGASVGVLGGLADPEDPMEQTKLLMGLLGSPRRPLAGAENAWLIVSPKGRSFVMLLLDPTKEEPGDRLLAFMHELEWRLGRGELEIQIYERPPEVIQ